MAILSYNRRLAWVVIPAVLWAFAAIVVSWSASARHGEAPPVSFQMERLPGTMVAAGSVRLIRESDERLEIVVAVPPGAPRQVLTGDHRPVSELPADLVIRLIDQQEGRGGRPEIDVLGGERSVQHALGRWVVWTKRYMIKFDRERAWIIPRTPELDRRIPGRWRENDQRQGWPLREDRGSRDRPPPPPPAEP